MVYHGSTRFIPGALQPVLMQTSADHIHDSAAVFATENKSIASLFMLPSDALFSIGYEQGIAYVCIWGTPEEFKTKDKGGYIYILPSETFEKRGKAYEWQSAVAVTPTQVEHYATALEGMRQNGARVYFINDDAMFDRIQADKTNRLDLLKDTAPYQG